MLVGIRWNYIDGPGGPDGQVTPDLFELGPRAERVVTVHVRSRAVEGIGECASDVRLTFYWGPNLTRDVDGNFDRDSADGEEDLQIHVEDDFTGSGIGPDDLDRLMMVIILFLILVIIALVAYIGVNSKRKASQLE
jgi:hypothetical protein